MDGMGIVGVSIVLILDVDFYLAFCCVFGRTRRATWKRLQGLLFLSTFLLRCLLVFFISRGIEPFFSSSTVKSNFV